MSIDYQNEMNRPHKNKYNLKSIAQDFCPQKTYSKRMHHNTKKINQKYNLTSNVFSPLKKDNNKSISTPQNNPISNSNTCYKTNGTNGFSPYSTRTIFSQTKTIKEKNIRKKIKKKKKTLLSMKYIGFIKDNNINNKKNHNYFKLIKKSSILNNIVKDDDIKNIHKNINKEKIKYIFLGEKNYSNNNEIKTVKTKTNELVKELENKDKIKKNINSFSCPNIKLNERINKAHDKSKNNNNFEIHNLFFESSKDDVNNFNELESHTISTFRNIKRNKGKIFEMKNIPKNQNVNIKNNNLNDNNKLKEFMNNKIYDLNSDIEMFDPITFIKNSSLYKDYLERKQKEKLFLKKLLKNKNIEELLANLNIYDKNKENEEKIKSIKIKNKSSDLIKSEFESQLGEQILNSYQKKGLLNYLNNKKYLTNNKLINTKEDIYFKTYLKPSDYINDVARKILEDIGFFRNKVYFDKNDLTSNNYGILHSINNENISKEKKYIYNKNRKILSEKSLNEKYYKNLDKNINGFNNFNINNHKNTNSIKAHINSINSYINTNNIHTYNNNIINGYNTINNGNIKNETHENNIDFEYTEAKEKETNDYENNKKFILNEKYNSNLDKKNDSHYISLTEKNKTENNKRRFSLFSSNNTNSENKIILGRNVEGNSVFKKFSLSEKPKDKESKENMNIWPGRKHRKNNSIKEKRKKKNKNEISKEQEIIKEDNKEKISKEIFKNLITLRDGKNNKKIYGKANLKNIINEREKNNKKEKKNEINIDFYDKLYGFNIDDVGDDIVIMEELKKIDIDEDLKNKLIENRNIILNLLNKKSKTEDDYQKLRLCRKRIKLIIKKLIEKMKKENLTKSEKSNSNNFLPKSLEGKKALYRYLRFLELKIRRKLEKEDQLGESAISSERESDESFNENSNSDGIKFFSFLDIKEENNDKLKVQEKNKKSRKNLIYDNLYLYHKKDDEKKDIEIKQEVYDILNEKNDETNNENGEKMNKEENTLSRGRRGKFTIRRRKFTKRSSLKFNLKKLEDDDKIETIKENDDNDKKNLERRIAKFYEKIQKLKRGEIDMSDYEDELSELMTEQIDKINYEVDKAKELRIINFFKNFQISRKNDLFGKNYLRNRLTFNSPINFISCKKIKDNKSNK